MSFKVMSSLEGMKQRTPAAPGPGTQQEQVTLLSATLPLKETEIKCKPENSHIGIQLKFPEIFPGFVEIYRL